MGYFKYSVARESSSIVQGGGEKICIREKTGALFRDGQNVHVSGPAILLQKR